MADDRFNKLKEQLELQEWPAVYFFKFIMPNDDEKVAKVTAMFDEGSDLNFQPSRTGKYISVSIKELMLGVDQVITRYEDASKIEGVIAL